MDRPGSTRQARILLRGAANGVLAAALALALALLAPAGASATTNAGTRHIKGELVNVGQDYFTVQMPGIATGVLPALTAAATQIGNQNLPYVWGGGHGQAGVPSIGVKGGPGYNGKRIGYDCSGAVAAVLVAAGLWPAGSGVPNDAGVIQDLLAAHLIAKGAGTGPEEVTLYDDPGVHIFMNIDGRFFGTSDGGGGGDAKGGPGWLDDGAADVSSKAFKRYHFFPSVLAATSTTGLQLTFSVANNPGLVFGDTKGDGVAIVYKASSKGMMIAKSVKLTGEVTTTGVIASIGGTGQAVSVTLSTGATRTFTIAPSSGIAGLLAGDGVDVTYTKTWSKVTGTVWTAHAVTVTNAVVPPPVPTTGGGIPVAGGTTTTG